MGASSIVANGAKKITTLLYQQHFRRPTRLREKRQMREAVRLQSGYSTAHFLLN
jgi:hypothetical protein